IAHLELDAIGARVNDKDKSADLGAQYTLDLLRKFQLSNEELIEVFDYCKEKGLTPLCTPWDLKSLEVLENYGIASLAGKRMSDIE
ncbi:N-acetylneuraminate synthase family protein, partial [Serratia marcescens]|uniref:N-acetylneuraminate synthase family protein n=1 Tax=Serratia marcescens TaxID=615 RepID=UPI001BCC1506